MRQLDLFSALPGSTEGVDIEFKAARGGLPGSFWESYSAMANTQGGTILLGAREVGDKVVLDGVPDARQLKQVLWDQLNSRQRISRNLLKDGDISVLEESDRQVVVVRVPRAERRERPVYVGTNPFGGTYRRAEEGDYRCSDDEVRRMFADQTDEAADARIIEHATLDDLDNESIRQYRNRFASRDPDHAWLSEDDTVLLRKLGALGRDRASGRDGVTFAGLLMFGRFDAMRELVPSFHVDYRERLAIDPAVRWTDRLVPDGSWESNLFQFFQRVVQRLTADLKVPFQLDRATYRKDDTQVHEAIREALVNALIHADHRGQGGVVIERFPDRFELSNPGSLLVSMEQLRRGGVSECRNRTLQMMFQLMGGGDKAGSGMDKIRTGWRSQHWRSPKLEETQRPDRVKLILPMVSLIPEEIARELRERFGPRFERLDETEVQAIVTARVEGRVTNGRMQEMTGLHPNDITRMLQSLAREGLLVQQDQKRWASYRIGGDPGTPVDSPQKAIDSPHRQPDSPQKAADSPQNDDNSPQSPATADGSDTPVGLPGDLAALRALAEPVRSSDWAKRDVVRSVIVSLCRGRWLKAADLAQLTKRDAEKLQSRFLTAMVKEGLLELRHPDVPNRPDQAYRTRETP